MLAILGCDPETLKLLAALVRQSSGASGDHPLNGISSDDAPSRSIRLAAAGVERADEAAVRGIAPDAELLSDWQDLVGRDDIDAVLVAAVDNWSDRREEALRKLVQDGTPLIVHSPPCLPLLALELDMIRRETRAPIVAFHPGDSHPVLGLLAGWVAAESASPIGRVEQVVVERTLADRSRERVLSQLARDATLVRAVVGPLRRVNASGSGVGALAWNSLNVQLSGPTQVLARWSVEAGADGEGTIKLIGQRGRAILHLTSDPRQWSLELALPPDAPLDACEQVKNWKGAQRSLAEPSHWSWPAWSWTADVLSRFEQFGSAASGSAQPDYSANSTDDANTASTANSAGATKLADESHTFDWPSICRDLEIADTAEHALQRGRAVELHHGTVTEEDTFKGLMSAVGCLLLLLLPLALIAAVAWEGIWHGWHKSMSDLATEETTGSAGSSGLRRLFPICVATPLVAFLGLQLLRLVFRPSRPGSRQS
ncbi:MAG TPA: hypothetical protein PLV92_12510 [Pirellulaceae bacterium]|nr:hypothetical protein [Pirellulaceae bacterium]